MSADPSLEREFGRAVRDDIRWLQQNTSYDPTLWIQMISDHGPVLAGTRLVKDRSIQYGLWHLVELGIPERSIEYRILTESRWRPLFGEDTREMARRKLEALGIPFSEPKA